MPILFGLYVYRIYSAILIFSYENYKQDFHHYFLPAQKSLKNRRLRVSIELNVFTCP